MITNNETSEPDARPRVLQIFVSYSRKDSAAADAIVVDLEEHRIGVKIDNRDLPYGERFKNELLDLIRTSDAVIWLVTEASAGSRWCQWELDQAEGMGKRLVPVRLSDVDIKSIPAKRREWHFLPATCCYTRDFLPILIRTLKSDLKWVKEHTRIGNRALRWNRKNRPETELLRGGGLVEAERWLMVRPESSWPSELQIEFIQVSREESDARDKSERKRQLREIKQLEKIAEEQAARAALETRRRKEATSRQLAAQSLATESEKRDLSILLALEAHKSDRTREAQSALLHHLTSNPHLVCFLTPLKRQRMPGFKSPKPGGISFSIDGRFLAHIIENTVHVWEVSSAPNLLVTLPVSHVELCAVAFRPDGRRLAAIDANGVLYQWSVSDWNAIESIDTSLVLSVTSVPGSFSIAFLPNSHEVVIASGHMCGVIDTEFSDGKLHLEVLQLSGLESVFATHTSRYLFLSGGAAESNESHVVRLDIKTGEEVLFEWRLCGCSTDRRMFFLYDAKSSLIHHVDSDSLKITRSVPAPKLHWQSTICVSDAGDLLIHAVDNTPSMVVLDSDEESIIALAGHRDAVDAICVSPGGQFVATRSFDGGIVLWSVRIKIRPPRCVISPQEPELVRGGFPLRLSFDSKGAYVAGLNSNGSLRVWDCSTEEVQRIENNRFIDCHGISQGWIAISDTGSVFHITASNGVVITEIAKLPLMPSSFACDITGQKVVFLDQSGALSIHDIANGSTLQIAEPNEERLHTQSDSELTNVGRLACCSKAALLAVTVGWSDIELYDLRRAMHPTTVATNLEIKKLSFTHDNGFLLVTAVESFQLLELSSMTPLVTDGTGSSIGSELIADVSPDGAFLAWKTHYENTIEVYDGLGAQKLGNSLPIPRREGVYAIAFSPDGSLLAGSDSEDRLHLWDFTEKAWAKEVHSMVNRDLSDQERRLYMPS